jgi:hypothetical protein
MDVAADALAEAINSLMDTQPGSGVSPTVVGAGNQALDLSEPHTGDSLDQNAS